MINDKFYEKYIVQLLVHLSFHYYYFKYDINLIQLYNCITQLRLKKIWTLKIKDITICGKKNLKFLELFLCCEY